MPPKHRLKKPHNGGTKTAIEPTIGQSPRKKGKIEPLPVGDPPHTAFLLSLKVPSLKAHVAQHGLPLFSGKANIFESKRDEFVRRGNEELEKTRRLEQQILARKKLTQARAQRRKEESQLVKEAVKGAGGRGRYDRIGFLTLRYNSIGLSEAVIDKQGATQVTTPVGDTTSQTLASAPQTAPSQSSTPWIGLPAAETSPTNDSTTLLHIRTSSATRTNSISKTLAQSVTDRPLISPLTPFAPVAPRLIPKPSLTPSDSNDSRRPSLLQTFQEVTGQGSPIEPTRSAESTESTNSPDPFAMSNPPNQDLGGVDDKIRDVIQNLYDFQQHVHGFRPEQQERMIEKVEDIAASLQELDTVTKDQSNPIQKVRVAPDIIDYVDAGRNPDIYTREFVELVQRGNSVINGKQKAFRDFSKIFAEALKENFDGMDDEVDTVMRNAGMEECDGKFIEIQQNGHGA